MFVSQPRASTPRIATTEVDGAPPLCRGVLLVARLHEQTSRSEHGILRQEAPRRAGTFVAVVQTRKNGTTWRAQLKICQNGSASCPGCQTCLFDVHAAHLASGAVKIVDQGHAVVGRLVLREHDAMLGSVLSYDPSSDDYVTQYFGDGTTECCTRIQVWQGEERFASGLGPRDGQGLRAKRGRFTAQQGVQYPEEYQRLRAAEQAASRNAAEIARLQAYSAPLRAAVLQAEEALWRRVHPRAKVSLKERRAACGRNKQAQRDAASQELADRVAALEKLRENVNFPKIFNANECSEQVMVSLEGTVETGEFDKKDWQSSAEQRFGTFALLLDTTQLGDSAHAQDGHEITYKFRMKPDVLRAKLTDPALMRFFHVRTTRPYPQRRLAARPAD